jgi:hypothetical protein
MLTLELILLIQSIAAVAWVRFAISAQDRAFSPERTDQLHPAHARLTAG